MEQFPPSGAAGGVWPPPPTNTPDEGRSRLLALLTQYRSPVSLTRWMIGFVAATVLADVIETLMILSGPAGQESAANLAIVSGLVSLTAGILFLVWTYRIYKNLSALGVSGLRTTPGVVVVMCFLPIVCIYKPIVNFGEIWRATAPPETIAEYGGSWRVTPFAPIIACWWITYLIYSVVSGLISTERFNNGSDMAPHLIMSLGSLISGGLLIALALQLSKREELRYNERAASLRD
ncbi:MAG: zinc-ribbon protein [Capsulimonas sp.]|jgi:hypothetical protein|nr:zinc-ribbon protein [Capsulimonas sp.]